MSFRLGAPGDAGMVPLSLRETAKGGKKMIQLAALKQVSSFFQRSHPRAKRKPDPRIKALPGGSSPLWRSMLADLYNCPVKRASSKEGPALGVALLAATGAGIYSSVPEACKAVVKTDKVQQPEAERVPEYEKYYKLYTEIYPALKAEFAKLAKM